LHVQATDQLNTLPPPWLAEALQIAQLWRASGLVERLQQQVQPERGRMGRYLVCDFVLVLLAYALSGEATLESFFAHLQPVATLLMAAWNRKQAPHRSTLSRFLAGLESKPVEQLRSLFLSDLNSQGFGAQKCGGLFDRTGQRWLIFDIDGTRACVRQRAIPTSSDYPKGRRRCPACAPGYTGRKRGELVRTRTAVLQAHTGEWLAGLAAAGNGSALADIKPQGANCVSQAGQDVGGYLKARGFGLHQGIVRMDGLYGSARHMQAIAATGLGVIVRGKDYGLLKNPWVMRCIEAGPTGCWRDPDTGVEREVFDVGILENWPTAKTETGTTTAFRLMVTARTLQEGEEVRIGKRKAGRVWELFITTLPQQGFTGVDILNLYLGRGLLENCLRHEDREQQIDRWVNIQANGQSFWQLIALWVSNQRLWLGNRAESGTERTTLWSTLIAPVQAYSQAAQVVELQAPTVVAPAERVCMDASELACVEAPSTTTPPYTQEAIATPSKKRPKAPPTPTAKPPTTAKPKPIRLQPRKREPFTHKGFRVTDEGQVSCPAGQPMSRRNRIRLGHGHERWIFAARYEDCLRCPLAVECMGEALPKASCRQVAYRRCLSTGRLLQEDDPRLEPLPVVPPSPPVLLIAPPLKERWLRVGQVPRCGRISPVVAYVGSGVIACARNASSLKSKSSLPSLKVLQCCWIVIVEHTAV
jgi:hypothetical protein